MASRNLTDVFILMRNNAIRNKQIYAADRDISENMQLVSLHDVEQGDADTSNEILLPPFWTNQLEDASSTIAHIQNQINDLRQLHQRHLDRSTFDDNADDEHFIEDCVADITLQINVVHKIVQSIKVHSYEGSSDERLLTRNVIHSIAVSLQDVSTQFRQTQSNYLKQLKSREERSKQYSFDTQDMDSADVDADIDAYFMNSGQRTMQQQLLFLEEESTRAAQQREQEVNSIVKSILDLNDIYKDLSQMVADQGTILDRIDYNIEQTSIHVFEGYKQLQKAEAYTRKNRKMCAIIILAGVIILLVLILIIFR